MREERIIIVILQFSTAANKKYEEHCRYDSFQSGILGKTWTKLIREAAVTNCLSAAVECVSSLKCPDTQVEAPNFEDDLDELNAHLDVVSQAVKSVRSLSDEEIEEKMDKALMISEESVSQAS